MLCFLQLSELLVKQLLFPTDMSLLLSERLNAGKHSIKTRKSQVTIINLGWFVVLVGASLLLSALMLRAGPKPSMIAWLLLSICIAAILYRPRFGVYLLVGLGLAGDATLTPWFPFVKNFSSSESILYINDAIIINPLEAFLGLTFLSWFIHSFSSNQKRFYGGPLFLPTLIFLLFVVGGMWYGFSTRGNINIGLWEARPLFYLAGMLILVSNLIETRRHVNHLLWFGMVAIFIESLFGNWYFWVNLRGNLAGVNAITEHSAAIHMNALFVFFFAALLYKTNPSRRLLLGFFSLIVLFPYFATQRRAAFLTLAIALILIAIVLYKENRTAFWVIVPPAVLIAAIYVGVFWNQTGPMGAPAQALKSVIAPEAADARNQSSNLYRDLENINLHFTIQQKPLTGIGFGHKFYVIVPMADISFFQWWEYFPHNSIIWIWLKTGVLGFLSMLFLVGSAIATGGQLLRQLPRGELSAAALTAVLYLIMHFTFAYADISWDNQSMIFVGAMMGLLNCMDLIAAKPESFPKQRAYQTIRAENNR
jgi:O-antigen ligase